MVEKLIIANWKMNLLAGDAVSLLSAIKLPKSAKKLVICPSFVYIASLTFLFPKIDFGAQNCAIGQSGAYTGEVSAQMLHNIGCKYVIIGHSERRDQHHETNYMIAQKIKQAVEAKIEPIICIGESIDVKNNGTTVDYLMNQLTEIGLTHKDEFIVAYEPIWAIGSGVTSTIEEIETLFSHIKSFYPHLRLLYGGSVDTKNSAEILAIKNLDGLLIGGASLSSEKLNQILL